MYRIVSLVDNTARRSSQMWGEHGLALWIETPAGNLLYDTGQSGTVLLHNAEKLGVDLGEMTALVISHSHYDHTGGLMEALRRRQGVPLYAHSSFFRRRYSFHGGEYHSIGLPFSQEQVESLATLHLHDEPAEVLPGVWTTGEIRVRAECEGRSAVHFIREGDKWIHDPYDDDLSLVLQGEDALILICGCCHAGLLNTLAHVRGHFSGPVRVVMGGLHLAAFDPASLAHVVEVLAEEYQGLALYPCHCSGENAFVSMSVAFGEQVHSFPAGEVIRF